MQLSQGDPEIPNHSRMREYIKARTSVGGGVCYGYRPHPKADGGTGAVIEPEAAKVVREIFTAYADGDSARGIADGLNKRGVPSPGATWQRHTRRRDGKWVSSTINAMIRNERYTGTIVWNRSRRVRKPLTGEKVFQRRDATDVMRVTREDLRIIDAALWNRVQARLRHQSETIGAAVKAGLSKAAAAGRQGAIASNTRYLLSGILVCGECGSRFIVQGAGQSYTCATRSHGGKHACSNGFRIPRARAEAELLGSIREELLSDEAVARFQRRVRELYRTHRAAADAEHTKRTRTVERLRREVDVLTDAIVRGGWSKALSERLAKAEADLAAAERDVVLDHRLAVKVVDLAPNALRKLRARLAGFDLKLKADDLVKARREIGALLGGSVKVLADGVAEYRPDDGALVSIALGASTPPASVAGVRY